MKVIINHPHKAFNGCSGKTTGITVGGNTEVEITSGDFKGTKALFKPDNLTAVKGKKSHASVSYEYKAVELKSFKQKGKAGTTVTVKPLTKRGIVNQDGIIVAYIPDFIKPEFGAAIATMLNKERTIVLSPKIQ